MTYIPRNVPPNPGDLPTFLRDELPEISRGTRFMVNLTAAQIESPSSTLLLDREVIYRLNASPYTLYHSNGSALIPIGSGGAAISAKLQSLDAASTADTIPVVSSATTLDYRDIGVTSASSIPDRSAADSRFLRWFTSLPDTGIGADGDIGVLFAEGYPGVYVEKVAGTWAVVDDSLTFAQMLAISSPVSGMEVDVSYVAMGGDIGNRYVNQRFRYDGTYWKPRANVLLLDALAAPSSNVLNAAATIKLRNMAPPAGLFHPGSSIEWEAVAYNDNLTAGATYQSIIKDNGTAGTTIASSTHTTAGKSRHRFYAYCHAVNRLTFGGVSTASGSDTFSTVADVEVAADFNGTRTIDFCAGSLSATDSSKNFFMRLSRLLYYPHQAASGFTPPPPPPAPSPPSMPMGTLTTTGTARNGPGRFAGFKMTAGSGAVRLYNGPDASYPLIQEVTAPVVDDWNYVTGITVSDSTTWSKVQNLWAVLAGSGQTVQFAVEDFLGSMHAATSEAAELTRITAPFSGATTYYWKAKTVGGAGAGTVGDPFNGARALNDAIAAGTVTAGDIVEFDYSDGACTIASEGADWPNTASITTRFSSGSARNSGTTNPAGIIIGSNMVATSTASGIWFKFDSSQTAVNWSGASNTNRRAWAGIRFQGEGIVVTGCKVIPPNWSYIRDPSTGATRCPNVNGNAEDASYENHGLIVFGNGCHIHDCHIDGDKTWSGVGILAMAAEEGVTGATSNLRGSVSYCTVNGTITGIQARTYGATGYDLEVPSGLDFHHNTISDPGWGVDGTIITSGSGNAAAHGNGLGIQGKWFGNCLIFANEVSGNFQDGIAGTAAGVVVADNYIHDLNRQSTRTQWYWTGSAWSTQTVTNQEGNGIKGGLTNKDRKSGATWLGTDGTPSTTTDSLEVAELRWIYLRNVIRNVQGCGITSNESNGGFIHGNEIIDTNGAGIILVGIAKDISVSRESNWYITNNFVKKVTTGPGTSSNACIRYENRSNNSLRVWQHNNILWASGYPTLTQWEMFVESGTTFMESSKNVLVKARISGTYSTASDLTDATSLADAQLYVASVAGVKTSAGLPVGNSLRTAGVSTPQTASRTHGCYLDFRGAALHASTPCVGPCNAP
jgi:hypothetical protein